MEHSQLEEVLSLTISTYEYELSTMSYVYNIEQYESNVCPCRCIHTLGSIIINFYIPVNKRE